VTEFYPAPRKFDWIVIVLLLACLAVAGLVVVVLVGVGTSQGCLRWEEQRELKARSGRVLVVEKQLSECEGKLFVAGQTLGAVADCCGLLEELGR
jgi:hypothetical protein